MNIILTAFLFFTPAPFTLVDGLDLSIEHLKRHKRAPHEGFLLTLGDLNLIRTRLNASDRMCDTKVLTLKSNFDAEIKTLSDTYELELIGYAGRIDDLNAEIDRQKMEIEDLDIKKQAVEYSYKRYRILSYITAGILVGGFAYSHIAF